MIQPFKRNAQVVYLVPQQNVFVFKAVFEDEIVRKRLIDRVKGVRGPLQLELVAVRRAAGLGYLQLKIEPVLDGAQVNALSGFVEHERPGEAERG